MSINMQYNYCNANYQYNIIILKGNENKVTSKLQRSYCITGLTDMKWNSHEDIIY